MPAVAASSAALSANAFQAFASSAAFVAAAAASSAALAASAAVSDAALDASPAASSVEFFIAAFWAEANALSAASFADFSAASCAPAAAATKAAPVGGDGTGAPGFFKSTAPLSAVAAPIMASPVCPPVSVALACSSETFALNDAIEDDTFATARLLNSDTPATSSFVLPSFSTAFASTVMNVGKVIFMSPPTKPNLESTPTRSVPEPKNSMPPVTSSPANPPRRPYQFPNPYILK